MKHWLPPKLMIVAAGLAFGAAPSMQAADILWQATGSGAWITGGNWDGGVMPGSADVAQFGANGPEAIALALHHPSYNPKGQASVGAISVLTSRTARDVTVSGNANASSVLSMTGATLLGVSDTIFLNQSSRNLTIAPRLPANTRDMSLALRAGEDHVVQVRGAGNVTISAAIGGDNATLSILGTGAGVVTLSGSNTYSGGTIVREGTLVLDAANAAGSGVLTIQSGVARVSSGVAFTNAVKLTSSAASFERGYAEGSGYNGFSASYENGEGAVSLTASLLGGQASAGRTLSASFQSGAVASNDQIRLSEVLELSGTGNDIFVLELRLEEALSGSLVGQGAHLAWLQDGAWVNAVEGNSAQGENALLGYQGSYTLSGAGATADYLGSWGYDAANQSVWAILDHQSAYTVAIPEPGTVLLLGAGAGLLVLGRVRRRG